MSCSILNNFIINLDSSVDDGLEPILDDDEVEDDTSDSESQQPQSRIVLFLVTFLLKFQLVHKISDRAILLLLKFIKYLIEIIGKSLNTAALQNIHTPASIQGCHSLVGSTHMPFKEYVVCPTCHMLFDPKVHPLTEGTTNNKKSVKCKYVKFPNHPQARFRMPCDTILLYTIKKRGNKRDFRARKTYCYYGLKSALTHLLNRPSFLNTCNSWKDRLMTGNLMADFIDGKVWMKSLQYMEIQITY